jgi:hypothetical protein
MGMPHSAATDSFCACCLAGTGRFVAARCIAFLRCKYARRRLRLICTRCCCPMESLWIENRRNAISIENRSCFFNEALWSWLRLSLAKLMGFKNHHAPSLAKKSRLPGVFAVVPWTAELTSKPHGSGAGCRNRNCFFTRFVVKRHAYGAKRIGNFCGNPRKLERVGRNFSIARGVFCSAKRPQNESSSRRRRDAARANACESNGRSHWSPTKG